MKTYDENQKVEFTWSEPMLKTHTNIVTLGQIKKVLVENMGNTEKEADEKIQGFLRMDRYDKEDFMEKIYLFLYAIAEEVKVEYDYSGDIDTYFHEVSILK